MNKAESQRIANYFELCGYQATSVIQNADLVVLNTCVVRQSAENKIHSILGLLKGIKNDNPHLPILVTGCFADSNTDKLNRKFPQVDLFFKPGDYNELFNWAEKQGVTVSEANENLSLSKDMMPCAFVPIIQGCNNFCSYCIVPYRRGREKSRPMEDIIHEVTEMVKFGTKEITLLGQNVNSYGHDLLKQCELSELLAELNNIEHLYRIRFLTNHPKDMSRKLIETIGSLDKVCEHVNIPLQAGDDSILKAMRRDYTVEHYRQLVKSIRQYIPDISLSTDVIVGFPGETEKQFEQTLALLKEIRFDTVHVAAYSPRPGTIASREFEDDVPLDVKKERLNRIEICQANIASEINSQLQNKTVDVLVEGRKKGKWFGRTRSDKLVFFENEGDFLGQMVNVTIGKTASWSLQGEILLQRPVEKVIMSCLNKST